MISLDSAIHGDAFLGEKFIITRLIKIIIYLSFWFCATCFDKVEKRACRLCAASYRHIGDIHPHKMSSVLIKWCHLSTDRFQLILNTKTCLSKALEIRWESEEAMEIRRQRGFYTLFYISFLCGTYLAHSSCCFNHFNKFPFLCHIDFDVLNLCMTSNSLLPFATSQFSAIFSFALAWAKRVQNNT